MEQHSPGLLFFRLHRHEAHRREQPRLVPELSDLAATLVIRRASLHRDHSARPRSERVQQFLAAQLPAERDGAVRLHVVKLKAAFRQLDPDDGNPIAAPSRPAASMGGAIGRLALVMFDKPERRPPQTCHHPQSTLSQIAFGYSPEQSHPPIPTRRPPRFAQQLKTLKRRNPALLFSVFKRTAT